MSASAARPRRAQSGAPRSGSGEIDVIVVAAGRSSRMGGMDKLDALLGGRPLLARTLDAVAASAWVDRIVVVASPSRAEGLRRADWLPRQVVAVVDGGERRQESVAAGLAALDRLDAGGPEARPAPEDRVVLVHDGARPLLSRALVERVAAAASRQGAVIPVVPVLETVKRIEGDRIVATIDRSPLATAQTPQGFRRGLLRAAHSSLDPMGATDWTDEAALVESCGIPVHVVPGDPSNIKVTLPEDLAWVDALVSSRVRTRVGIGRDSHPFGPGSPLVLGGVEVPGAPRLHGHSDGDVALHAVADALLGAAGLGDLGRIFPAGPSTPAGISSGELLTEVVRRVAAAGYRPASIDLTIVAARPHLERHLPRMASAIAALLGVPEGAVNVKASSGNLAGMEGAGRGASAEAVAQLETAP